MSLTQSRFEAGVSIVIPAYNYERYLGEAIASALAQDYSGPVEVLVIDDGSTDGTALVAATFGAAVVYHWKHNAGLSAARNTGMALAAHDLVVFLDADDLLERNALSLLVEARTRAAVSPVVLGSLGRMIDADGVVTSKDGAGDGRMEEFTATDFVMRNRFPPIVLADRRVLLQVGGFDPQLKASEDRDMWIRAATMGPVARLNQILHRKRDHGDNMSRQAERQTESILQVLTKASANPALNLSSGTLRAARAVCFFQSARMHLTAGDEVQAVRQCLRSVAVTPWVSCPERMALPSWFRMRFLLLRLRAWWCSKPRPNLSC